MEPKWNGLPCKARRVIVTVAPAAKPTYWYASLSGKDVRAVEVTVGDEVFYIADEDGNGWHKVIKEGGGPHWSHKGLEIAAVVRERAACELDDRDCYCGDTPPSRRA